MRYEVERSPDAVAERAIEAEFETHSAPNIIDHLPRLNL
jgi:hypothetical protein